MTMTPSSLLSSSSAVKISLGALVGLMFTGLGVAVKFGWSLGQEVSELRSGLTADNRIVVHELQHLSSRVDETNANLKEIVLKTDGHLTKIMEIHQRQGEFSHRIDSLEKRVDRLETEGQ